MSLSTILLAEFAVLVFEKAKEPMEVALAELGFKTIFKKIGKSVSSIYNSKNHPENGELLKAVRIAMLDAAILLKNAVITDMKIDAAASPFSFNNNIKIIEKQFTDWILKEKKLASEMVSNYEINTSAYKQIEILLNEPKNQTVAQLRFALALNCKKEFLHELKYVFQNKLPPLTEELLLNGWNDNGKKDWFDITCFLFSQILKKDEFKTSRIAFQDRLLSEVATDLGILNCKFDDALDKLQQQVSYGQYINEKLNEIKKFIGEFKVEAIIGFTDLKETTNKILNRTIENSTDIQDLQKSINENINIRIELNEKIDKQNQRLINNPNDEIAVEFLEELQKQFHANIRVLKRNEEDYSEKIKYLREKIDYVLKIDIQNASNRLRKVRDLILDSKTEEALVLLKSEERIEEINNFISKRNNIEMHAKNLAEEELILALDMLENLHIENRFQLAIPYFENSLKYFTFYENLKKFGQFYLQIGYTKNALTYFEKALTFLEQETIIKDERYSSLFSCIGSVYHENGYLEKAIKYNEEALKINLALFGEENENISTNYNNLGVIFKESGDFDKSIKYLEKL
ncbi:MAG: tetratricopeptide repeat protein [Saprospiraceae bacterium]|nr:tetratricopeptide repeat protein [Saprospiraceae bacterium]